MLGNKGKRLYRCEDCKHEQLEHWIVRTRRARVRCPRCGSAWYDIKTAEGCTEALNALDQRRDILTREPGDFVT